MYDRGEADYAEHVAARIMTHLGFPAARPTQRSNDGGLDVVAPDGVAQVKWQETKVGRPALQNLVGAAHGRDCGLLFFTKTGYSAQAEQYAQLAGIELFTFTLDGAYMAHNEPARQRHRYFRSIAEQRQRAEQAATAAQRHVEQERQRTEWARQAAEQLRQQQAIQNRLAVLDPVDRAAFIADCERTGRTPVSLGRRVLTATWLTVLLLVIAFILWVTVRAQIESGTDVIAGILATCVMVSVPGFFAYRACRRIQRTKVLPGGR